MMEKQKEKRSKRSKLVIAGLVLLSVASAAAILWKTYRVHPGSSACIYQNGTLIRQVDLSGIEKSYTIRIDGTNGAYNILQVSDGRIGVVEASCPDKLCVKQGFIANDLMPVTCLPNHLVIQVVDGEDKINKELDGISY